MFIVNKEEKEPILKSEKNQGYNFLMIQNILKQLENNLLTRKDPLHDN